MSAPKPKSKDQILSEFDMMRSIEESARDFYREIVIDPRVESPEIKQIFARIAEDEQRHIEIVDRIMHCIRTSL
jgi:rubrerythrin